MRLVRASDGVVVVDDLRIADTYLGRLRGLIGTLSLPAGQGLWLEPCDSIHMLFMRFAIDAVFLRRAKGLGRFGGEVLRVCEHVQPWSGLAWCRGASCTLEVAAGRAAAVGLRAGDRLRLEGVAA